MKSTWTVKKTFDCNNHTIVIAKLEKLGIKEKVKWIKDFLTGRRSVPTTKQTTVTDDGEKSIFGLVKSGVLVGLYLNQPGFGSSTVPRGPHF